MLQFACNRRTRKAQNPKQARKKRSTVSSKLETEGKRFLKPKRRDAGLGFRVEHLHKGFEKRHVQKRGRAFLPKSTMILARVAAKIWIRFRVLDLFRISF